MKTPEQTQADAKLNSILTTTARMFDLVEEIAERQVRTETRLVKLLLSQGLDVNGQPVEP